MKRFLRSHTFFHCYVCLSSSHLDVCVCTVLSASGLNNKPVGESGQCFGDGGLFRWCHCEWFGHTGELNLVQSGQENRGHMFRSDSEKNPTIAHEELPFCLNES